LKTNIVEIFTSIQGEGPYLGYKQIFLRFAGCNLQCAYCDTTSEANAQYIVEFECSTGKYSSFDNPATPEEIADILKRMDYDNCHSISLTGGEPLLNTDFINLLSSSLGKDKRKFYLETNGTLPLQLNKVIDCMDIKLPSVAKTQDYWEIHREFLEVSRQKEIFVKIVVTAESTDKEILKASEIIKTVDLNIPLIIQPVEISSKNSHLKPSITKLFDWQKIALNNLTNVRIIPQIHKILGVL
jgi:7-carboxy-7-deazaguanine synthase